MLSKKLKLARIAKKLSQRTVAGYLDIPYTVYRSYERGESEPPSEVMVNLCELLGMSNDWILELNGRK